MSAPSGPRIEEARAFRAQALHDLRATDPRQEVVGDDPLVVPGEGVAGLGVRSASAPPSGPQEVHQPVVGLEQRQVQRGDDQVHVVARIADQGDALCVARQVGVARQRLRGVARVVQVGAAHRPALCTVSRFSSGERALRSAATSA